MATTLRIDSVSGDEQFQILYTFNGNKEQGGRLFADRAQAAAFAVEQLGTEEVLLAMVIAYWLARDLGLNDKPQVLSKTLTVDWNAVAPVLVAVAVP